MDTTASGVDDVELGKKLNDAVRDFLVRTHCYVTSTTLSVDAAFEDVPTTLAILDLYPTNGSWRIERTTPAEIYGFRMASAATSASAPFYYALNGGNRLEFYPTPSSAVSLTLIHVPKPTELSSANDDPSSASLGGIPQEYHPALEEYAKWKMADYDDDSSSQMGQVYQAEYMRLVRDARKHLKRRGGRSLPRAVVGRRPVVPSTPSTDLGW